MKKEIIAKIKAAYPKSIKIDGKIYRWNCFDGKIREVKLNRGTKNENH